MSNWKDYFVTKSNTLTCTNESAEMFKQAAMPTRSLNETIGRITADRGNSILIYFSKISNSIQILHSITNLGNNNLNPLQKVIALNGTNDNQATPIQIDIDSLSKDVSIRAPTAESLFEIQNKDDLMTIEAPDQGSDSFKHLPFILLPPFLWEPVLSSESRRPEDLFLKTKKTIQDFETKHSRTENMDEITESCHHVLHFFWAATKDTIPSITFGPLGDDDDVRQWSNNRHTNCLTQNQPRQLTHNEPNPSQERELWSIEAMNQILERSNQSFNDEQGKSKKGFDKLHE